MIPREGVILAAGRGFRMGELGREYPKPIMPIYNQPLIVYHLKMFQKLGIKRVHVIVNYMASHIAQTIGDYGSFGFEINYIEQNGELLGSAHSLAQVAPYIDEPFLLVLGDYYFSAPEIGRLMARAESANASVMAVKREPDRQALCEACAVETNSDGRILHIHEKPRFPATNLKGCGLYAFQPEIFDAVNKTPRTALRNEYELTLSLELFIQDGYSVYAEDIIEWDVNLTRPADILRCNIASLELRHQPYLIGSNTSIPEGSNIGHAVIGKNVIIDHPVSLHRVLVFDESHIDSNERLENVVITPRAIIPCLNVGE